MAHMAAVVVLALVGWLGGGDWWVDDPFACPEPDQPNCGAPNGAGDWVPDELVGVAPAALPVAALPAFTG